MIIYFADRYFNILGQASTSLPEGLTIKDDLKTEDIETGVASFDCYIGYNSSCRSELKECTKAGNYILRSNGDETEFYTIIESEDDTGRQQCYVYAEDAGLDLLNEVFGDYSADKAYNIAHYVNKFAYDSGFVIKRNEIPTLTRKLSWEGDATGTERIASVVTQFGAEISYSFDIKGLKITNKYINIYKKRGQDLGCHLRLNEEVNRIVTKQSIANIATAYEVEGGTPEDSEKPITLSGYKYDDGDFYVSGTKLLSRKALKKWSRYLWKDEPNQLTGSSGHIVKKFSYDTTSQSELCTRAVSSLKKVCDMEINYEIDIAKLPENAKIGDTVNIIDDAGELYLSTRILKLETSVTGNKRTATLGDFLIKGSGISQKVADLAEKFSKSTVSASRALAVSNAAKTAAAEAQSKADSAITEAENATTAANAAAAKADTATQSAAAATDAAQDAENRVQVVEDSVSSLETTVANAQTAAENAHQAATTAQNKADSATTAAAEAKADADAASAATVIAQEKAETAITKAETAQSTAESAQTAASEASSTALAAKKDAAAAHADIDSLGEQLETVSNTMAAEYARKTDLTEATASLQTQISQNASEIRSTATKVQTIDETANSAKTQAEAASAAAQAAQQQADTATADAAAAQTAADNAAAAASAAQSQADSAKADAAAAQAAADKADADLTAAKADLATVQGRVDATEEDIAAAQQAVVTAQAAADKAKADATAAANAASAAQTTADTAVTNAANAQKAADDAADKASVAQAAADAAKGDAAKAQTTADQAAAAASAAQSTANTAKTNAEAAQAKADQAFSDAAAAQSAADAADAKAAQAAADLATAKQNLEDVTSRVGATEDEIAAAQQAVVNAQSAADAAASAAATAQTTADTAKTNAANAQTAANAAKTAADAAQEAADNAQAAADKAQSDADSLAVRVTTAETNITQNAEQIALRATKTEVAQTLGGYYTKEQTDSAIVQKANEITSTVSSTYATKTALSATDTKASNAATAAANAQNSADAAQDSVDNLKIGGRNYFSNVTKRAFDENNEYTLADYQNTGSFSQFFNLTKPMSYFVGKDCVLSFDIISPNGETAINVYNNNGKPRYLLNHTGIVSLIADTWTHQTLAVTVTDRGESEEYSEAQSDKIEFYCPSQMGCKIRNVKFEIGTRETDWTQAPEDVETDINEAKTAADNAQTTANNAQNSANNAQADVDALTTRVTSAETKISQNESEILLRAKKTEVQVVSDALDNLEIGGRNLVPSAFLRENIVGTGTTKEFTCSTWANTLISAENTLSFLEPSTEYALSYDAELVERTDVPTVYELSCGFLLYSATDSTLREHFYCGLGVESAEVGTKVHFSRVFTTPEELHSDSQFLAYTRRWTTNGESPVGYDTVKFTNFKIEKGNRATDWTPAPEDTDKKIDDVAAESESSDISLNERITEKIAEVLVETDGIIQNALESYITSGSFGEYKEEISSQLSQLSSEISLKFSQSSEMISELDETISERLNEINTYFTFDINGFTIGKSDNPYKIVMSNDRYSMMVNDIEVLWIDAITKTAHIPSLVITEKLAVMGYEIALDASGNLNCMYVGG